MVALVILSGSSAAFYASFGRVKFKPPDVFCDIINWSPGGKVVLSRGERIASLIITACSSGLSGLVKFPVPFKDEI